jgi:hypothetical protein
MWSAEDSPLTIINIHGNRAPEQDCLGLEWWCCVRLGSEGRGRVKAVGTDGVHCGEAMDMALLV